MRMRKVKKCSADSSCVSVIRRRLTLQAIDWCRQMQAGVKSKLTTQSRSKTCLVYNPMSVVCIELPSTWLSAAQSLQWHVYLRFNVLQRTRLDESERSKEQYTSSDRRRSTKTALTSPRHPSLSHRRGHCKNTMSSSSVTSSPHLDASGIGDDGTTVAPPAADLKPWPPLKQPAYAVVLLAFAYAIVVALGLVNNLLVVIVVWTQPTLRTVTNFFLANLAVADVLVCIIVLPITLLDNIFTGYVPNWIITSQLIEQTSGGCIQLAAAGVEVKNGILLRPHRRSVGEVARPTALDWGYRRSTPLDYKHEIGLRKNWHYTLQIVELQLSHVFAAEIVWSLASRVRQSQPNNGETPSPTFGLTCSARRGWSIAQSVSQCAT